MKFYLFFAKSRQFLCSIYTAHFQPVHFLIEFAQVMKVWKGFPFALSVVIHWGFLWLVKFMCLDQKWHSKKAPFYKLSCLVYIYGCYFLTPLLIWRIELVKYLVCSIVISFVYIIGESGCILIWIDIKALGWQNSNLTSYIKIEFLQHIHNIRWST